MKRIKRVLPLIALVCVVTGLVSVNYAAEAENDTIPNRVYIGDIAVGGMTAEEAEGAVNDSINTMLDAEFTLKAGTNEVVVTAEELGVTWTNTHVVDEALQIGKNGNLIERYKAQKDLENEDKVFAIEYQIDAEKTGAWLDEHASELNQDAINGGLKREDGGFTFIEGQEGIEVDVDASVKVIAAYFEESWGGEGAAIELTANVVQPRGTEEELSKVTNVLGIFSTYFGDSAAGRIANVKNAAGKIDGTLLYPGEEFSVYEVISPMTFDNGYEIATAYENGTTVDSIGGGVCQVSTTLYNAVIRAELEIVERYNHSMIVTYVDPSADAAIAGTYKDLKFKNNTDSPIYIESYTSGGTLYMNVFGNETRAENRKIAFKSEVVKDNPAETKFETTSDPIGTVSVKQKEHDGKIAKLWKIITVDGKEESREVFNNSTYNASPRIISVGISSDNKDAVKAIKAAIKTGDEAAVKEAAEYWSADAIAKREKEEEEAAKKEEKNNKKNSNKKNDDTKKEDNTTSGDDTSDGSTGDAEE